MTLTSTLTGMPLSLARNVGLDLASKLYSRRGRRARNTTEGKGVFIAK
jgi:hypothetical protein